MRQFPFPFYGAYPTDWYEGANAGHRITVAFVCLPTPEQQRALAATYDAAMGNEAPETERWSGRFLELIFGDPEREMFEPAEHLEAPSRFLRRAHQIVPIQDAVYHGIREGSHAGPADMPPKPVARPPAESFARSNVSPSIDLSFERIYDPSDALRAQLSTERSAVERENPGALAVHRAGCELVARKAGDYRRDLTFTPAGGEMIDLSWSIDEDLEDNITSLALPPDAGSLFVLTEGRALRMTLPDETVEVVCERENVCDIEAASSDLVVVADGSSIRWIARSHGGWVEQARQELPEANYILAVTESVVVMLSMDRLHNSPEEPTHIYVFDGSTAQHVAAWKEHPRSAAVHDGRWIVRTAVGYFHVRGLPV